MILVAQQTVLARQVAGVTGLAEILFHRAEVGYKRLRIALLVALQIGAVLLEIMAGQTPTVLQDAEMWLMDEICEASLFTLDGRWGEIGEPPLTPDIVDAMTFRA